MLFDTSPGSVQATVGMSYSKPVDLATQALIATSVMEQMKTAENTVLVGGQRVNAKEEVVLVNVDNPIQPESKCNTLVFNVEHIAGRVIIFLYENK